MGRIFYNLAFFLLLLSGTIIAGSIKGKVENGTAGFQVPPNTAVELSRFIQNQQDTGFKLKTNTDGNGYFSFQNVPESPNAYYQPTVFYKGVSYAGESFTITPENQDGTSNVTIYEPTKNDSLVQVSLHHFLIIPAEGYLSVKEVSLLENIGDRTYIGSVPTQSGKFITVRYKLPKDAYGINLEDGLMSCCIEPDEDGFYDTMEILPGKKQIVFSYKIKAPDEQVSFSKQLTIPTGEFGVLLYGSGANLTSSNLQEMPPQNFEGTDIKTFTAENLIAGQQVDITLSGLSGEPADWSNYTLFIIAGVLLLAGIFIYFKQKKNTTNISQTDDTEVPDADEREITLRKIVMLDEKYEAGEVIEKDYLLQREKLKNKLKTL